eukprot:jgi/Mesvir1/29682/Mv00919-RA.1
MPGLLWTAILLARFLRLEREDGVACLRLALWAVWCTFTELLCVVRLIIYYPELMVEPLVHLSLKFVCAVLRLVRRISQLVCAMLGVMAATKEFHNIMVALSIVAIVIVAEIATVGHDGIVFALCKPDLRLELGAVVGTVGWYILLGFWHRAAHCPWQQCSNQVWTSHRSTTVLHCYRLPRHPGIVRRLAARHRPMRRRHCARRLPWAPVPLFGARPRRGRLSRVRCIIRRRLPRPQRSAWRPNRYSRAVLQRGPGPARQSRQQRRRMRASAAAMGLCARPVRGGGEPMYDGDCEIPLPGEEDLCEEGGDSDMGERIDVTGDWDESCCVRTCIFTTAPAQEEEDTGTTWIGCPSFTHMWIATCRNNFDSRVRPKPRCTFTSITMRRIVPTAIEQADCLVGNPSAWVAFVRGKIDELVNAAPDKFSDNIYYAMLMLQRRVGPVVPWPRSASETLLAEVAGYWAHGFVQAATALVGDPLQCMATLQFMMGILHVRKSEFSWDDYCMAVTSIQNNLRYWETLRVQMERQGCDTMTTAPVGVPAQPEVSTWPTPMGIPAQAGASVSTVVAGRKFQSASSFLEAALACDGTVGERLVTVEHYLRIVEGRRDVLYGADYEPAVAQLKELLRYWMERSGGQVAETAQGDVQVLQPTAPTQVGVAACATLMAIPEHARNGTVALQPGSAVDEPRMGASAVMMVDVTRFETASEFVDAAFTGAANVWERLARIQHLLNALEQDKRFPAESVDAAMRRLKDALRYWNRKWSDLDEVQQQRLQSGSVATTPHGKVPLRVRPAVVAAQEVAHPVEARGGTPACVDVDPRDFKMAVDFVDLAKSFSRDTVMSVEEKIARLESLLDEVRRWKLHASDPETIMQRDMAVRTLQKMVNRRQGRQSSARRRLPDNAEGKNLLDMINARVQPAVPGIIRESPDAAGVQARGNAGRRDAVVNKLNAQRRRKRDSYLRQTKQRIASGAQHKRGKKDARMDDNDADDSEGDDADSDARMDDNDADDSEGADADSDARTDSADGDDNVGSTGDGERIDPVEAGSPGLSPPGSDGKRPVDDVAPVTKETQRQKNKRENDEMKKFGMTLPEVRRLSRCLDTGDYAGFRMRPFKLRPLTDDPSAAHPYSLDEHRERSKCPKCHAPMFKEEEPKRSRCCSKGKAKVLEPNLNLIIEKRRQRERLLAEANADERELARNELTHQEEMLWQIHCNPTNVALWIRYGRMINQFFAVARIVASGRIGDSVKNKGACVLELHGQTIERIKPIIRDGVHVNNDFFFLLDKPGKDEAQEDVLKRCEVKERDPNLRKLLDLLEEYLLTYNPLLQQFARQATEELEQRQASVEVAGQFSPEVHAPEIFLLPSGQRNAQPGHFRVDVVERGPEGQRITKELPLGSKDYMALAFPAIHSEGKGGGGSLRYDGKSKRKQRSTQTDQRAVHFVLRVAASRTRRFSGQLYTRCTELRQGDNHHLPRESTLETPEALATWAELNDKPQVYWTT